MQDTLSSLRSEFSAWAAGIGSWWSFITRRRRDGRFDVFPQWFTMLEWLAVAASLIIFLVLVVDRLYLKELSSQQFEGNGFFALITDVAKSNWILILTGAVMIALSIATSDRFRGAARRIWHRVLLSAWYIFFAVAASGLTANLLKLLFGRARPELVPEGHVWFSRQFTDIYDYGSFPSGHSTTAGALAVALALLFPRFRVFLIVAGVWLAIARPAVGVHFPSDALAGFLLGAAFSYFSARNLAVHRLLFRFDDAGHLTLRGERKGALKAFTRQIARSESWRRPAAGKKTSSTATMDNSKTMYGGKE